VETSADERGDHTGRGFRARGARCNKSTEDSHSENTLKPSKPLGETEGRGKIGEKAGLLVLILEKRPARLVSASSTHKEKAE